MSVMISLVMLMATILLSILLGKWITYILEAEFLFQSSFDKSYYRQQDWKQYTISMLVFNSISFLLVLIFLSIQQYLPLNPDNMGKISPSLVFHTVASFVANTNQQHYSGETTMSYWSQLFGLMWLQFVSCATGLAALAAVSRGLAGKTKIGNFYKDLKRIVLLVLIPLALVEALVLLLNGVPMTFEGSAIAKTLEGVMQVIARGPVAAFVAIKQLGSNGGGFFGVNSAHPFENTNLITNWIEWTSILLIPMACVWVYGRITGFMKHAKVIFGVMLFLCLVLLGSGYYMESKPATALTGLNVTQGGNLEGKEVRLATNPSVSWAVGTTVTSNGSVNCMHDSLNPLSGLIALIGMWINSIFGGVGVGMLNMLIYIIIGVFICGMMIGRSPEYLTRKVETKEMRLAILALLQHPLFILVATAWFCVNGWGASTINNPGAHGFTEILYEFSSASANNGSGFEGLRDNTTAWNIVAGIIMLLARFIPIILPLMISGSMAEKQTIPITKGTFRTDTVLFGIILTGSILFIGALLFLPVAFLGPIAEYLGGK